MTEPAPGDFGVVHMGGDSGRLIHLGQILNGDGFADYEHAFMYVGNGKIIESEPGGAKLADVHYNDILWSTGKIEMTDLQRAKAAHAAYEYLNTQYSAMDYFALAAYRLKLGPLVPGLMSLAALGHATQVEGYVSTSKHMISSQLVDQCYQDAGVQLFNDKRRPGYVTPGALAKLIS
jgi:hypothetical protein